MLLLTLLLLTGCGMTNTHLRSAVPLQALEKRCSPQIGTAYSYVPLLKLKPENVETQSDKNFEGDLSWSAPICYELGLGRGFLMGGKASLGLGPTFNKVTIEDDGDPPSLVFTYKLFVGASYQVGPNLWMGVFPTYLRHHQVWKGREQFQEDNRFKHTNTGFEYPITLTRIGSEDEPLKSSSFTFRFSHLKTTGKLNHNDVIYKQPAVTAYRYALIHTRESSKFRPEINARIGRFIDIGVEFTTVGKEFTIMPILGYSHHMTKSPRKP